MVTTVIFDLGGVVTTSPLPLLLSLVKFNRRENIQKILFGQYWELLEKGEWDEKQYIENVKKKCHEEYNFEFPADQMMKIISLQKIQGQIVDTIHTLKRQNFKVVALTNNWERDGTTLGSQIFPIFPQVFESCKLKMRKPEPEIYKHVLATLNVNADEVVFLDDLGSNLKSAAALGIKTIQVSPSAQGAINAIAKLESYIGRPLTRKKLSVRDAWKFCEDWLPAWTGNHPQQLAEFYSEDAFYLDPVVQVAGRENLLAYFCKLLGKNSEWIWQAVEVHPLDNGGFSLKWVCLNNNTQFYGMDIVVLDEDSKITRNEVYFNVASSSL